jgi:hypothetical protein
MGSEIAGTWSATSGCGTQGALHTQTSAKLGQCWRTGRCVCARARCRPSVESPACASCHGIPCRHGIATPLCHNRARWDAQAGGTCHATVREGDRDGDVRVDARDGLDDADRDGSCTTCTEQAAYIQHATCSVQHAACNMQRARCNMQRATCSVQLDRTDHAVRAFHLAGYPTTAWYPMHSREAWYPTTTWDPMRPGPPTRRDRYPITAWYRALRQRPSD